jgi:hypothetical protein
MVAIGLAVVVLTAGSIIGAYGQEPPMYGNQVMTEQEPAEYRARMHNATQRKRASRSGFSTTPRCRSAPRNSACSCRTRLR